MLSETKTKMPFEKVYERYYFEVFRYVCAHLPNRQEAEDLTSDAFVYCYTHYDNYNPEKSAVSTWLYLVVKSRLKNWYRDKKQLVDISELEGVLFSEGEELGRAVYLEQIRNKLSEALSSLPEKQRRVVILRFFHEKEYGYIASELGTTEGNVRVILSRALDRLEVLCEGIRDSLGY